MILATWGSSVLRGLNHITISVSDLEQSFIFYVNLLGMIPHVLIKPEMSKAEMKTVAISGIATHNL